MMSGDEDYSVFGRQNRVLFSDGKKEAYLCFGKSGAKIRHNRASHIILQADDVPRFMSVLRSVLSAQAPNPPEHRNSELIQIDGLIYIVTRDICRGHWDLSIRAAGPVGEVAGVASRVFAILGFTDTEVIEILNSYGPPSEEIHCTRFCGFAHAWSLPYEVLPAPQHRELALEALDIIADALYCRMDGIRHLRIVTENRMLKISLDLSIDVSDAQLPGVGGPTLFKRLRQIEKRSINIVPVLEL